MTETSKAVAKAEDAFRDMQFAKKFITDIRNQLIRCLSLETTDHLPAYFRSPMAMPAKIGIRHDLVERFNVTDEDALLSLQITLSRYFQSDQYHQAMIQMTQRYSLDLEVTEELSEGDHTHYRIKAKIRANKRAKKAKEAAAAKQNAEAAYTTKPSSKTDAT